MHYELYFTDVYFVFIEMCKIHKIKNMKASFFCALLVLPLGKKGQILYIYINYYYYYYLNYKLARNSNLIYSTSCLILPLIVKGR